MNDKPIIDLRKEQEATLARPHMKYTGMARALFKSMDILYGAETILPKVRLLEVLARIPYQAWETRQYARMSTRYHYPQEVKEATAIVHWGREAQDNEFWHLLVIEDKMRQDGVRESWFRESLLPRAACFKYVWFSRLLARVNIRRAFYLNAEFEDHAEHAYMEFVRKHPELEALKVESEEAQRMGPFASWADVFRRIALDERDHMNNSLRFCGLSDRVVPYLHERKG